MYNILSIPAEWGRHDLCVNLITELSIFVISIILYDIELENIHDFQKPLFFPQS